MSSHGDNYYVILELFHLVLKLQRHFHCSFQVCGKACPAIINQRWLLVYILLMVLKLITPGEDKFLTIKT